MKNLLRLVLLSGVFYGSLAQAQPTTASLEQGTLRVTVMDADGNLVPDAPVYIVGEHRTKFMGGADVPGTTTFTMKEGTYRISSALVKKTNDYIDRFSSNEAHISVIAGDNVSIVLTLKPMEVPADQMPVSYAQLHVAGIPGLTNN